MAPISNVSPEAAYVSKDNIAYPDERAEVAEYAEKVGRLQLAEESGLVEYQGEVANIIRNDPNVIRAYLGDDEPEAWSLDKMMRDGTAC